MIDTRILSRNKGAGITQLWHEHTDGSVTIETKQDITDIIENNKATYNNVDGKANWKGEMHKVGSIPMSIYHDLQKQGILQGAVVIIITEPNAIQQGQLKATSFGRMIVTDLPEIPALSTRKLAFSFNAAYIILSDK